MGKKEKGSKSSKPAKAEGKKEKSAKADKPGTAKYTYPKDCVTDADKKKYRSLMRSGGEWKGPGAAKAAKKSKKDPGQAKAVILDGKGKKVREEVNHAEENSKKKKKKEKASQED